LPGAIVSKPSTRMLQPDGSPSWQLGSLAFVVGSSSSDDVDARKAQRKARNRKAAAASRDRKKEQLELLHLEVEKLRSENAGLRRRLEVSFDPVPPAAGFPPKHRRLSRRRRLGSRQPKTRQRRQPHPYYPHPRPRPRPRRRRRRRPSWRHCSRCCWPAARRAAPAASRASSRPLSLSARTFRGRGGAAARQARAATPKRLRASRSTTAS